MDLSYALLYAVIAIVSIAVYWIKDRMSYWKKRGVPYVEPTSLQGNIKAGLRTRPLFKTIRDVYREYKGKGPFCGFYILIRPAILILDLDLIKRVLIKDFNNFVDRVFYHNERDDPLSGHLIALGGNKWRQLRSKLTPTFTSAKMKFMFPTVVDVGHRFAKVFGEMVGQSSVVEITEVLARFTTDVIGTCAFGIECNSLRDPNAEFHIIGQKVIKTYQERPLIVLLTNIFPNIARALRCRVLPDDVHNFFMRTVRETVEYREKNGIVRNDFMNMLIELKNKKSTTTKDGEVITGLTMNELAAQAFIFFMAGYETSSTTMGFALYELALNPDIQDRLRKEVNDVFAKHGEVYSYECMKDMRYMDQVISETLRKYTMVTVFYREAKEDYIVPNTNYKIEKGMMVLIPADAIHHDPEIYPNPEVFDPERFSPEEMQKRDPIAWLAFGDGPRNCIGLRFGKMQTRIGLSLLIKNFQFSACDLTKIPLEYNFAGIVLASKGGIHLRVEAI